MVTAVTQGRLYLPVAALMHTDHAVADVGEMLERVFLKMRGDSCPMLPVVSDGRLVGILTLESISQWVLLRSALRQAGTSAAPVDAEVLG